MNLLRRGKPDLAIDDYLADVHVAGNEIASLFGVSPGRVRQMAGSRENPDATLGAPRSGTNGTAEWPLRNVLQYAMLHARAAKTALPPLLPRPGTQIRYEAANNGRPLTLQVRTQTISIWAQLYRPAQRTTPHEDDGDVLLIVPLWPDSTSFAYVEIAAAYTRQTDSDWYNRLEDEAIALTVIELPSTDPFAARGRVHTQYVTAGDLRAEGSLPDTHRLSLISAADIAACLGWPAVPVWPEGTATAATVSVWAPGEPVPISVPAKWQDLWSAGRHAAIRAEKTVNPDMAASYRALDAAIQAHMLSDAQRPYDFADGTESAVEWNIDEPPKQNQGDWIPAVDDIVGSNDVPPFVADTLLRFFGDWRYSRPITLNRSTLPSEWRRRLEQMISTAKRIDTHGQQASARLRALERAAIDASGGTALPTIHQAGNTILAATEQTITWLAWNGYNTQTDDELSHAWPDNAAEILITMDPHSRRNSAWAATFDDDITALPHSQALGDFAMLARKAHGHSFGRSPKLESVLQSTTPDQPCTIPYPDFLRRLVDDEVNYTAQ